MVVQCICVVTSPSGDIKGVIELSQVSFFFFVQNPSLSLFLSRVNEPTTFDPTQESEDSPTVIKGKISGLSKGKHAISVNVFGDLSEDGKTCAEQMNDTACKPTWTKRLVCARFLIWPSSYRACLGQTSGCIKDYEDPRWGADN